MIVGGEFFEIGRVEEEGVAAHAVGRLATIGDEIALVGGGVEDIAKIVGGGIEGHAETDGADEASRVGVVAGDEKIAPADVATGVMRRENQGGAAVGCEEWIIDVGETAVKSGQRFGNTPTIAGFHQAIETARATCGENRHSAESIDEGGAAIREGSAERGADYETTGVGRE